MARHVTSTDVTSSKSCVCSFIHEQHIRGESEHVFRCFPETSFHSFWCLWYHFVQHFKNLNEKCMSSDRGSKSTIWSPLYNCTHYCFLCNSINWNTNSKEATEWHQAQFLYCANVSAFESRASSLQAEPRTCPEVVQTSDKLLCNMPHRPNVYCDSSWRKTSFNICTPLPSKKHIILSEEATLSQLYVTCCPPKNKPGTEYRNAGEPYLPAVNLPLKFHWTKHSTGCLTVFIFWNIYIFELASSQQNT